MRLVPTIIALTTTAVAAIVGTGAYLLNASQSRPTSPALLANLPGGDYRAENAAFRQRVLRIAPIGSPESGLTTLLKAQGFRMAWEPSDAPEHEARYDDRFRKPSLICGSMMQVWWSVDQAGRITGVRSLYSDDGCP